MDLRLIFKKGFIGSNDLGILGEALLDAGAQPDNPFNAVGGEEGIAENLVVLLPNTVDTPRPLDQADDRPG